MPKNIIILSDGIPGHVNQSKGIATLLSTQYKLSISIIEMTYKFRPLRSIITFVARFLCKALNPFTAKIITSFYNTIPVNSVDLVIAAGGNTAPLSAALHKLSSIPTIQLGSPRGLHASLFNALITVEKYFDHPANVVADISPNNYSPLKCKQAAESMNLPPHLLFLIGGQGIGYSYEIDEWSALVVNILKLHQSSKLPITIVTSRRTDPAIEKKLQYELSILQMTYSAWFHSGDKNFDLSALFGYAQGIFVTEDSAMMISESISSGQPVTTLFPSSINSPSRYQQHIQKYQDLGLISRESIKDFSLQDLKSSKERVAYYSETLKQKLINRIEW